MSSSFSISEMSKLNFLKTNSFKNRYCSTISPRNNHLGLFLNKKPLNRCNENQSCDVNEQTDVQPTVFSVRLRVRSENRNRRSNSFIFDDFDTDFDYISVKNVT